MLDAGEYSSSSSAECLMTTGNSSISRRKNNKNKRRFSDDQIKSLETIFDTETKLEPKKKLQLARELGLQPRQVAIWFQNKRARWKSKQLERDYALLQSDYENLLEQIESLKKERQTLLDQLQKLNDLIDKSDAKEEAGHEAAGDGGLVNEDDPNGAAHMNMMNKTGDDGLEVKKPIISEFFDLERTECGGVLNVMLSDDDADDDDDEEEESSRNPDCYLGLEEETELPLNIVLGPAGAAQSCNLREPEEEWGTLESDGLLEQPSTGYKWWDFWS